ncbi:hypothetical protein BDF19DRAFT_437777 [Syncephalis fuscata]|nr:hypothetical protein BDF19DRAFT_437777 [Syncephalis fuscata]
MFSAKKQRIAQTANGLSTAHSASFVDNLDFSRDKVLQRQLVAACPPHPLGVRPEGNPRKFNTFRDTRTLGLGRFARFPDELILQICQQLPAVILAQLEPISKALYVFARHEENWKDRVLDTFNGRFHYSTSWRVTFINCYSSNNCGKNKMVDPVQVQWMYSDTLFRPWHYAAVDLDAFVGASAPETVDRRHDLSLDAFVREYEQPNRPVIIADGARDWPALKAWTQDQLLANYGDTHFRAEKVDITLADYWAYAEAQQDESPLYLFDRGFTDRCVKMQKEFTVPNYFSEDLFSHLGNDKRPDYRWLIVGPARSGSTFHKDPNATSAWNAVVSGAKKWILFPPETMPPGVYATEDESEVTAPVSVMEWFHHYYAEARRMKNPPLECVCRTGEIMFVPRGWWHCVINLEFSVAVTQNYVSRSNLSEVLAFLRDRPCQISGLRGIADEECGIADTTSPDSGDIERAQMYARFCNSLIRAFPDEMSAIIETEREAAEARRLRIAAAKEKSSWWAQLRSKDESAQSSNLSNDSTTGFCFSFVDDKKEDSDPKESESSGFCFNFNISANES